jgi:hypothetical protein
MATDAVLGWVASFVGWIGGLIQLPDPPNWIAGAPAAASAVAGYVADTGSWIPWTLMQAVILTWVTVLAAGLAIKVVRIVASFLTLGGGSAA